MTGPSGGLGRGTTGPGGLTRLMIADDAPSGHPLEARCALSSSPECLRESWPDSVQEFGPPGQRIAQPAVARQAGLQQRGRRRSHFSE
jgi:hypothetical protein